MKETICIDTPFRVRYFQTHYLELKWGGLVDRNKLSSEAPPHLVTSYVSRCGAVWHSHTFSFSSSRTRHCSLIQLS